MIPVKLRIEGFLSYRELVELDFTGFSLACISGPNGAGKSSLLDAITWALFGQARKRDESLINNHPEVKAAEVIFDFEYEGNLYRVQRTNPRGKTSSVEFFVQSEVSGQEKRWKTLSERTLRETDKKIEETLRMDFDTFTNAAFFLQGQADKFATASPGQRKNILSNILGLEIWETYREAASQRGRQQEKVVRELDGRLAEIQAELDEEPERKAHFEKLQTQLSQLETLRDERAKNLEQLQRLNTLLENRKARLESIKKQLELTAQKRDQLIQTLDERREEKAAHDEILAKADHIQAAYEKWQQARQALEKMDDLAAQFREHEALRHEPQGIIQAEEARLRQEKQGLMAQKEELSQALAGLDTLKAQLKAAQGKVVEAEENLATRVKIEEKIRELQADQAEAKAENPRLKVEMNELKARIDELKAAEGVECPLCGQPLAKADRVALVTALTEKGTALADRFRENKRILESFEADLQELGGQRAALSSAEVDLREATRQADQIEARIKTLQEQAESWEKTGAARLAVIEEMLTKENFAVDARARLDEIDRELEALGYDVEVHENLRQSEQAGREAEANVRALDQARAASVPLSREMESLTSQAKSLEEDLERLQVEYDELAAQIGAEEAELPDIKQAESDLIDLQEQENRLRMEVGGARQKVDVLDTLKTRKAAILEEREAATQHIADLKRLERAFGKEGIPALLIEQALPEIEETTNDLLSKLSNGCMSFSFQTQREYKDASREDLRETLDIIISDGVGERDYELFSGGEAFRVNFSIRLALSKVLAKRAGARLQTLVIDEGFGSQDAQGQQRLVEAINSVRDDFKKILVITHLEELKETFPTRIEVEKTPRGSQLQVV